MKKLKLIVYCCYIESHPYCLLLHHFQPHPQTAYLYQASPSINRICRISMSKIVFAPIHSISTGPFSMEIVNITFQNARTCHAYWAFTLPLCTFSGKLHTFTWWNQRKLDFFNWSKWFFSNSTLTPTGSWIPNKGYNDKTLFLSCAVCCQYHNSGDELSSNSVVYCNSLLKNSARVTSRRAAKRPLCKSSWHVLSYMVHVTPL